MRKILKETSDMSLEFSNSGFNFFYLYEDKYWIKDYYYEFDESEIDYIGKNSELAHELCVNCVEYLIKRPDYLKKLHFSNKAIDLIAESYFNGDDSFIGRFDFYYHDNKLKLYEYNGDTPAMIIESGLCQKLWSEKHSFKDVNILYEESYKKIMELSKKSKDKIIYFLCDKNTNEDTKNMLFLKNIADKIGFTTYFVDITDLVIIDNYFYDSRNNYKIEIMFKSFPWEWYFHLFDYEISTAIYEPMWKFLLNNKILLVALSDLYYNKVDFILESKFSLLDLTTKNNGYVKKPYMSREGSNIILFENGKKIDETTGMYGNEGYIYQELKKLPEYNGMYPMLGSWIMNGKFAGIGMRETSRLITDGSAYFVPYTIR